MKFILTFEPHCSKNNYPQVEIWINDLCLFDDIMNPNKEKYFILDEEMNNIKEKNVIKIIHKNKSNKDTVSKNKIIVEDRAVELKSLVIDNFRIPEVYLYNQKFYPVYPENLKQEHPPTYITNNLYFGFNGTYQLFFNNPIDKWYYSTLLFKERLANQNNQTFVELPDGDKVETYEFAGKQILGKEKDDITIKDLHKLIMEENDES